MYNEKKICLAKIIVNIENITKSINLFADNITKLIYQINSKNWNNIIKQFSELEENKKIII